MDDRVDQGHSSEAVYSENIINCSFFWTIKNFKNRKEKKNEFLYSDSFEIHEPDGRSTSWKLKLYPRGDNTAEDGDISLFLYHANRFREVKITYECSIWVESTKTKQNSLSATDRLLRRGEGWHQFCKAGTIQDHPEWFLNENLKIVCDIKLISEKSTTTLKGEAPLTKRIQSQMNDDYSKLFLDGVHADVEIKCGDKTFPCHRSILSARSPVFKAMFEADMEETREGKVEIKDYSPEVIEDVLLFMYSGIGNKGAYIRSLLGSLDMLGHVEEMLKAADQYQIDLLKATCEKVLCSVLQELPEKLKNCLIFLIIGDMYHAEELKRRSMKMFVENMNEVLIQCPEDWKRCVRKHPDLTVEITTEMARRNSVATATETS